MTQINGFATNILNFMMAQGLAGTPTETMHLLRTDNPQRILTQLSPYLTETRGGVGSALLLGLHEQGTAHEVAVPEPCLHAIAPFQTSSLPPNFLAAAQVYFHTVADAIAGLIRGGLEGASDPTALEEVSAKLANQRWRITGYEFGNGRGSVTISCDKQPLVYTNCFHDGFGCLTTAQGQTLVVPPRHPLFAFFAELFCDFRPNQVGFPGSWSDSINATRHLKGTIPASADGLPIRAYLSSIPYNLQDRHLMDYFERIDMLTQFGIETLPGWLFTFLAALTFDERPSVSEPAKAFRTRASHATDEASMRAEVNQALKVTSERVFETVGEVLILALTTAIAAESTGTLAPQMRLLAQSGVETVTTTESGQARMILQWMLRAIDADKRLILPHRINDLVWDVEAATQHLLGQKLHEEILKRPPEIRAARILAEFQHIEYKAQEGQETIDLELEFLRIETLAAQGLVDPRYYTALKHLIYGDRQGYTFETSFARRELKRILQEARQTAGQDFSAQYRREGRFQSGDLNTWTKDRDLDRIYEDLIPNNDVRQLLADFEAAENKTDLKKHYKRLMRATHPDFEENRTPQRAALFNLVNIRYALHGAKFSHKTE